jgi:hypothetical protein
MTMARYQGRRIAGSRGDMRTDVRACRQWRAPVLAVVLLTFAAPAPDTRVWLASLNYESRRLVCGGGARSTDDRGHEWNVWLGGWTIGRLSVARTPRRRWRVELGATPVNANSSNYIYQIDTATRRPSSATRRSKARPVSSWRIRRGGPGYRGSFCMSARQRRRAEVKPFWNHSSSALETVQSYSRVRSETRLARAGKG